MSVSAEVSTERRIKFLSRNLPFPVDPTYREYRVINDVTGVEAQDIMTGTAGVWMLPVLAVLALYRADPLVSRTVLDKILDLGPQDITLEGDFGNEDDDPNPPPTVADSPPLTGTPSTVEIPVESGIPVLPTTSPEPQGSPTT